MNVQIHATKIEVYSRSHLHLEGQKAMSYAWDIPIHIGCAVLATLEQY